LHVDELAMPPHSLHSDLFFLYSKLRAEQGADQCSRNRLGEITAAKQRVAYKPLLPNTFERSRAHAALRLRGHRASRVRNLRIRGIIAPLANRVITPRLIARQPRFRTWPMSKTNVNCHKRPEINYIRNLLNCHVFPRPPPHYSDMRLRNVLHHVLN
jgi:hypothetical protein